MPTYSQGDYIKVEFSDETTGVGEWAWVRVNGCDDKRQLVFGHLDIQLLNDHGRNLKMGAELILSFCRIREHRATSEFHG